MDRKLIWLGLFVGSTVGGAVPMLWGADVFSTWPIILSTVGGVLGIWLGFKLSQ